jgi:hypothetical protein
MIIYPNSNRQITDNFTESELFSKSADVSTSHYLDDNTIFGLQSIRTYYNSPIRVTSTYRSPISNAMVGGVSNSRHLVSKAIDFQFINNNEDNIARLQADWNNRNEIYHLLRAWGINAIGFYTNFVHIDTRENEKDTYLDAEGISHFYPVLNTPTSDSYGSYQTWGTSLDRGLLPDMLQYSDEDGFIEVGQNKRFRFFFILVLLYLLKKCKKLFSKK